MIRTQTPPHEQHRQYDRYASASVRDLDVDLDGSPVVAILIDEDTAGVERVELRLEDVWVVRRDRDAVVRWQRPEGHRIETGLPDWGFRVLQELGLAGEVV